MPGLPLPERPGEAALRAALALLVSVCLHLSGGPSAHAEPQLASALEDGLLQAVRQAELRLDGAVGAVREAATQQSSDAAAESAAAGRAMLQEVSDVVESNFLDVRGAGFDLQRWRAARDRALARPLRDRPAVYMALRELLSELRDPYSRFIPPSDFGSMLKYDVSGVGLNLGTSEDLEAKTDLRVPSEQQAEGQGVWVLGLIKGSAADEAGLQQGDQLLEVDGQPLGGRSPFEVASLLQGQDAEGGDAGAGLPQAPPPSAHIRLTVRKLAGGSLYSAQLARPVQAIPSPVSSRLERPRGEGGPATGYIRLSSFNARAQRDVSAAVKSLEAQGASRLVLDLRDNRGGLVTEGIEVARLFLDGGAPVVRTESKAGGSAAPVLAAGPALSAAPLVVLVNDHTASASEIAAGALRDNCRAVLAGGPRTYGKGLIQSVYELSDGSGLVLTVGKYLTPAGTDIDLEGLRADSRGVPSPAEAAATLDACRLQRQSRAPPA